MGLKQTHGSGCGLIEKGDLGSGSIFHVEAKATKTKVLRVDSDWWRKAVVQADRYAKRVVLLQLAFMTRYEAPRACPHLRWVAMLPEVMETTWGPILGFYKEVVAETKGRFSEDHVTVNAEDTKTWGWKQDYPMPGPAYLLLDDLRLALVPEPYITSAALAAMEKTYGMDT